MIEIHPQLVICNHLECTVNVDHTGALYVNRPADFVEAIIALRIVDAELFHLVEVVVLGKQRRLTIGCQMLYLLEEWCQCFALFGI